MQKKLVTICKQCVVTDNREQNETADQQEEGTREDF